ncbi:MAG: pilus assembly protein [Maricaulaceae bacterium]|nr:pilus assembly protein [Maricaulaceae bacterium]
MIVLRKAKTGFLRRFRKDRSGASAVEFAMIAGPFLLLLLGLIEVALVFFAGNVLENATMEAARQVRTGQMQSAGAGAAEFRQRVCDRFEIIGDCGELRVDVRVFENFSTVQGGNPLNDDGELNEDGFGFDPGGAGDIVLVRVFYPWRLNVPSLGFGLSNMPGNQRLLIAATAFRNEPFDD